MNWLLVDKIIKEALKEDIGFGDITTDSIINEHKNCTVDLIAKQEGVVAGLSIFKRVFYILGKVDVDLSVKDGDIVRQNQAIGKMKGSARNILTGERLALNILQRMSGIATLTNKLVKQIEGTNAKLLDTRKTTPNMRILEKYAVKVGGGYNHRFNLSDGILIKDNHIDAAGSIKNAIELARQNSSFVRKIEVETETLEDVKEALKYKADIVMLDNMTPKQMKEAVKIIDKKALIEASGNVTLENIKDIAQTGVDYISTGSVTHSVIALDISMKNLKYIDNSNG